MLPQGPFHRSNRVYAGIGSSSIPEYMEDEMIAIGKRLARLGYTLRSGGAPGSDSAFEYGARLGGATEANGLLEIYLPFPNFCDNPSRRFASPTPAAIAIAHQLLKGQDLEENPYAPLTCARNLHQIYGYNLKTPELPGFICCWTPNGLPKGGTSMGIYLAKRHNIPLFNLAIPEAEKKIYKALKYRSVAKLMDSPKPKRLGRILQ